MNKKLSTTVYVLFLSIIFISAMVLYSYAAIITNLPNWSLLLFFLVSTMFIYERVSKQGPEQLRNNWWAKFNMLPFIDKRFYWTSLFMCGVITIVEGFFLKHLDASQ